MNVAPLRSTSVRSSNSRSTVRGIVLAGLVALVTASGCSSLLPQGPTPVAQGKYYGSGNAQYDDFFLELYRAQVHAATLPERIAQSRNTLTDGLTVSRDLATSAIIEHVRTRAQDLNKQGVLMKLDVKKPTNGSPATAVLLTRPSARGAATRQLAEPVEKSANELLLLSGELDATTARLQVLEQRRAELRELSAQAFGAEGPSKIGEVRRNLADAEQVLGLMRERATRYQRDTRELLDGLTGAVDTGNGAFERPESLTEAPEEPKPKRSGKKQGQGGRHSAPQKSSSPKSAPKAPASDPGGFEP